MSTFKKYFVFAALLTIALIALGQAASVSAQVAGAVFTTESVCDGTNVNIFTSKSAVYLDGGPRKEGSAGLPDGDYYVKVTEPDGTLLGYTTTASVSVVDGEFVTCYQLETILVKASDGSPGYDTTTNGGGEYKVWASKDGTFPNNLSKTDNFKVYEDNPPPPPDDTFTLRGCKFYDANANGVWDQGEVTVPGFMIIVYINGIADDPIFTGDDGCYERSGIAAGSEYAVMEVLPDDSWVQTFPAAIDIDLGNGVESLRVHTGFAEGGTCAEGVCVIDDLDFGNYCFSEVEGNTLGYWSNKNGLAMIDAAEASQLNAFCLRNPDGSDANFIFPTGFANKGAFSQWLLGANASNMASMLSAQMAATYLNIANGVTPGDTVIYVNGEFVVLNELIEEANELLCENSVVTEDGDIRDAMERLKNIFDAVNNDEGIIIHAEPCAVVYTF